MAGQQKRMEDLDKKKHTLCGCVSCFVFWLFPISLALAVALYFSPNERVADITEFNKRAGVWNAEGYKSFKEASFEFCVNGQCYVPELVEKASGALYPVGDKCDKDSDPKEGCTKTEVAYFSHEMESVKGFTQITLMNDQGVMIANVTADLSSKQFLKSACFRVRQTTEGYVLDVPPEWKLHMNKNETGCYFGNGWDVLEYSKNPVKSTAFQVRSYQDPFIAASSLTRGCNENEKNSGCFGITKKEMTTYGLYGIIAAGAVTLIELIILFSACCCCRDKIPGMGKDSSLD